MAENYSDIEAPDIEASRRRANGWIVLGALLLGLMLFLCTCRDSRMIQADLWARGRAMLESKGYDPEILSMNGRDATLTGIVPTEDIKADAEAVIRSIAGVRQVAVQNNLAVSSVPAVTEVPNTAPTPDLVSNLVSPDQISPRTPSLSVAVAAGTVTLSGLVAGGSRPQIIEAATELYGEANVVDNLEVADDVDAPGWLVGALELLPQVKNEVQEGKLEATPEGITLSGTAATEQAKSGLAVAAQSATGLTVQNNLTVATPDFKPATFAMRLTNGKAELSGTVPEATIAPAVEAASRAVGAANVINNLQAASDVTTPPWGLGLFGVLPALANAAPDLGVDIVDKNVTLTGTVSSPEVRESLAKQVQDAVGADVTVANQLQVAAQTPPQLRVKIAPDAVQVSGTVAQSTADKAVQVASTVSSITGSSSGSVVNQFTIGENVAQPAWLPALIDQVPTFAKDVQEAELNVQGSTITLVGAVPSEEQKATVEANMRQAVGTDPTIVNQLRVVAPIVEVQPALTIKMAENALTISGNVAQATAEQVSETMTTLPDVAVTNQLMTAENVVQPEWLPNVIGLMPTYTKDVQGLELDLKDNQVTLAGTVISDEKKIELGEQLMQTVGESVAVVNNLQIEAAEPVALRVKVVDGAAQIEGNVPEETAASVVASIDNVPDTTVTNEIQAASNVAMPTWLPNIVTLLPKVTIDVKDADVNIEGNTITLAGVVASEEKKAELAATMSRAAGTEVEVINNLTIEAPAPSEPVQLRVQIQDGVATVAGNVPASTASQITETVDAAPETSSVTNEIEAAPNVKVPTWLPNVVAVLPEATKDIEDADVNIVADTITLAGTVTTEERKTEVANTVKQAAGADVNVINNLTVVPEVVVEEPVVQEPATTEAVASTEPEVAPATAEVQTEESAPPSVTSEAEVAPAAETAAPATSETETSQVEEPQAEIPQIEEPASTEPASTPEPVVVAPIPTRNPDVRIEIAGNTVRLTGTVPSAESVTAAVAPYKKETVENLLEPSPQVANAAWLPKLYALAPQVANDLNRATLVLSDTTLIIQGTAPSLAQRDAIGKYVSDALQPDITVINRLTVQQLIPIAGDGK
jgi:osmotically-inducible protein OsmY